MSAALKHDQWTTTEEISEGNSSPPSESSFQDGGGAPVEKKSPLGYHVNGWAIIFLNVGMMVGTGVYSTPSAILGGTGSVGLSLVYWALGFVVTAAALAVYLELAAYFPNRSGSEVAYLEQAYPRPRYFFPVAFAAQSVLLSFSSSNSIVLSQYFLRMIKGNSGTAWEQKGVAVAAYTLAVLVVIINTKWSLYASNAIGVIKILSLVFISITGLVVLSGNTSIPPTDNFHNAFAGSKGNGNGLATALVKVIYAYNGFQNSINLANEVKNPIPTLKKNSAIALTAVAALYVLCNIAYFAVVPKKALLDSEQVIAALFFQAVFGKGAAARVLNILPVLSSFGNLVVVLIGQSRMIRECGRQGVLPWPKFWVSTRPFGTPLGPYLLKWSFTILMILAPPAGDAFNFIVDLRSYPDAIFIFAMTLGIYIIRRRWKSTGRTVPPQFRAWDLTVIFYLVVNVFLLVMPWWPPAGGQYSGDVSFWYATYCVAGIGIILACCLYYVVWIYALPHLLKYRIRHEVHDLGDGALSHRLVKVPLAELQAWDDNHDESGNVTNPPPRRVSLTPYGTL